ncbi:MAG: hypothetical protein PQ612_06875 [Rickettsiales bacterium]|nr:hypothetical protein [Pseudomonadota bacterium]MDA0966699.1 hypothetical protein [Pseudomonadota bacterium]MDG4543726.1 hypothetical protein [Rickettsiales bacterium]MDG4545873.1 hypothetical protein [Rickettsiales bacterium]MDG4547352.1 hypothetical protein [Rickettsiales bacterium]
MTVFGLTDFEWAILANDSYRRYELRGGQPEEGYDSNLTQAENWRRYVDSNGNIVLPDSWQEFLYDEDTNSSTNPLRILDIENDIFLQLRLNANNNPDYTGYDFAGEDVESFSAKVYQSDNPNANEIIVSFRGSESFEEIFSSINDSAWDDWQGNIATILADEVHPQINVAYYFTQRLKEILDDQFGVGGYELAFTGHSLGGLIASTVATLEGAEAVVMNPVPATDVINNIYNNGASGLYETIPVYPYDDPTNDEFLLHVPAIPAVDPNSTPTDTNVRNVYIQNDMARNGVQWDEITQDIESFGTDVEIAQFDSSIVNPGGNIPSVNTMYLPQSLSEGFMALIGQDFALSRPSHSIDNQLLIMATELNGSYELAPLVSKIPGFLLAMSRPVGQLEQEDTDNQFQNGFVIQSLATELVKQSNAVGYSNSVLKQVVDTLKIIDDTNLIKTDTDIQRQAYYQVQDGLAHMLVEYTKKYFEAGAVGNYTPPIELTSSGDAITLVGDDFSNYESASLVLQALKSGLDIPSVGTIFQTLFTEFQTLIGKEDTNFDKYFITTRNASGNSYNADISTTNERDIVVAMEGDDDVHDSIGDDAYLGGKGDDTFYLGIGSGNDFIHGGFGTDYRNFDSDGTDAVDYSDSTANRIEVRAKEFTLIDLVGQPDITQSYYEVIKRASDNSIIGTDYLTSIESIKGTSGNDGIEGDSNNNIINGGAGDDILVGGNGADKFIIARQLGGATTVITDFEPTLEDERIDLRAFRCISHFTTSHIYQVGI